MGQVISGEKYERKKCMNGVRRDKDAVFLIERLRPPRVLKRVDYNDYLKLVSLKGNVLAIPDVLWHNIMKRLDGKDVYLLAGVCLSAYYSYRRLYPDMAIYIETSGESTYYHKVDGKIFYVREARHFYNGRRIKHVIVKYHTSRGGRRDERDRLDTVVKERREKIVDKNINVHVRKDQSMVRKKR